MPMKQCMTEKSRSSAKDVYLHDLTKIQRLRRSSKVRPARSYQYIFPRKKDPPRRVDSAARTKSSYVSRITCPTRLAFYRQKSDETNLKKRSAYRKTGARRDSFMKRSSAPTPFQRQLRLYDDRDDITGSMMICKNFNHGSLHSHATCPIYQTYADSSQDESIHHERANRRYCQNNCGCIHRGYLAVRHKNSTCRLKTVTRNRPPSGHSNSKSVASRRSQIGQKKSGTRTKHLPISSVDTRSRNPNSSEQDDFYDIHHIIKPFDNNSESTSEHLKYGIFGKNTNNNRFQTQSGQTYDDGINSRGPNQQAEVRAPLWNRTVCSRYMNKPRSPKATTPRLSNYRRPADQNPGVSQKSRPSRIRLLEKIAKHKLTLSEIMHIDIRPQKHQRPVKAPKATPNAMSPRIPVDHLSSCNYTPSSKTISCKRMTSKSGMPPRYMFTQSSRKNDLPGSRRTASCRHIGRWKVSNSYQPDHERRSIGV